MIAMGWSHLIIDVRFVELLCLLLAAGSGEHLVAMLALDALFGLSFVSFARREPLAVAFGNVARCRQ